MPSRYIIMTSHKCSPCFLFVWPLSPQLASGCSLPSIFISPWSPRLIVVKFTNPRHCFTYFPAIFPAMGQVSFQPPTSIHATKTVTTRQQSPGGVPRFVARHYPWLGKQFFTKPEHMSAIWLALAPTITCCRSHVRLSRSSFVFHIAKGRTKSSVISVFPSPQKHRISGLARSILSSERLLTFISGRLRSGAWMPSSASSSLRTI